VYRDKKVGVFVRFRAPLQCDPAQVHGGDVRMNTM
jgi:hypothetical protein